MKNKSKVGSLYDEEVLLISERLNDSPPDIDRWLALLVGNELFNDEDKKMFFAGQIKRFNHLFDMILNWNYVFRNPVPRWLKELDKPWGPCKLLRGIDMSNSDYMWYSKLNFSGVDFSYSKLKNLDMESGIGLLS